MPNETNPAEFYLDLINTDLVREGDDVFSRVQDITRRWTKSQNTAQLQDEIQKSIVATKTAEHIPDLSKIKAQKPSPWVIPFVLLHRSWIKA